MENEITLYHGSYCLIQEPKLSYCFKNRDFGHGFYLTTDYDQAKRFVGISIDKAASAMRVPPDTNVGYVNKYKFRTDNSLLFHNFPETNKDWLNCVVAHRKRVEIEGEIEKYLKFDVITGKVADDNTANQINAYLAGTYGPVNSDEAVDICVRLLLTNRLKDQWCFRTEKALKQLEFMGSDKIHV